MANGSPSTDHIVFNGVNGATGGYLFPPVDVSAISKMAMGHMLDPDHLAKQQERHRRKKLEGQSHFGLGAGLDHKKLNHTGWGVIFAHQDQELIPDLKTALAELLDLRRSQAGELYREFTGADAYRPEESAAHFLGRFGHVAGPVYPADKKLPYYLLLVGGPESIPFRFQYMLNVEFAVGRIHFPTLREYAQYARSVVAAETGKVTVPRRAVFFGAQNPDDVATERSVTHLVAPLAEKANTDNQADAWQVETVIKEEASRDRLGQLLGGNETPGVLFTAGHGMYLPMNDPNHRSHVGAVICKEWQGPHRGQGFVSRQSYFAADDLADDASIHGLINFNFSCFGAGLPQNNELLHHDFARNTELAFPPQWTQRPFISRLPQRMLGHPNGGALAFIGHVERAWDYSFYSETAGQQINGFRSSLRRLLMGFPVGAAMEDMDNIYAAQSAQLTDALDLAKIQGQTGAKPDHDRIAALWMANNDARNYIILGDPAVRLPLAETGTETARPGIEAVTISDKPLTEKPAPDTQPSGTVTPPSDPDPVTPPTAEKSSQAGVDGSQGGQNRGSPGAGSGHHFSPFLMPPPGAKDHPQIYDAWVKDLAAGYTNKQVVFEKILNAFMWGHYSSLLMNWILFGVGIGFFIMAAIMGTGETANNTGALIFGGLSVTTFLTYFISRPTQAIEENLQFITWLGILYNSYWTHLAWASSEESAQEDIKTASAEAIGYLKELIAAHAQAVQARPGLWESIRRGVSNGSQE